MKDKNWAAFVYIRYGSISANAGGFYKCGALVARQYAFFVVSQIQFLKVSRFLAECAASVVSVRLAVCFAYDDLAVCERRAFKTWLALCVYNNGRVSYRRQLPLLLRGDRSAGRVHGNYARKSRCSEQQCSIQHSVCAHVKRIRASTHSVRRWRLFASISVRRQPTAAINRRDLEFCAKNDYERFATI